MTIKNRIIQALIILSIFLFTGCNANKNNEDEKKSNIESESMKNITENMQKDIYPEIEKPFKKRSFSSYMDEKWIGNAISYGCYREGQAPGVKGPSEAEILEDLNILSFCFSQDCF